MEGGGHIPEPLALRENIIAKTMVVFMVRGLFSKLQFLYAQFPCASLSGELLYDPFWEAVRRVENWTQGMCAYVQIYTLCYTDILTLNLKTTGSWSNT